MLGRQLGCLVVLLLVFSTSTQAQTCSADNQCPGAGMTRTQCAGNMLVTSRDVCAGSCRTIEVSRTPCLGACVGDRCMGESSAPRVDPAACAPGCVCRGGTLNILTGRRTAAGTCEIQVRRCTKGCTCEDQPRCL